MKSNVRPITARRPKAVSEETAAVQFDRNDLERLNEFEEFFTALSVILNEAGTAQLTAKSLDTLTMPTIDKFQTFCWDIETRFKGGVE